MTTQELCKRFAMSPALLRKYESLGIIRRPEFRKKGVRRSYQREDCVRIVATRLLLQRGMNLKKIGKHIGFFDSGVISWGE